MSLALQGEVLERAARLRAEGTTFVVATVVRVEPPTSARPGDKAVITGDGRLWGWIGGSCSESLVRREAIRALQDGQPRLVRIAPETAPGHQPGVVEHVSTCPSAGSLEVFIDPQQPQPLLLVVGATPAAHTLLRLGSAMGFRTAAMHPGARRDDFSEADVVLSSLDTPVVTQDCWAVVATMGHYDEDALAALLPRDLPYLGVIASRRRMRAVLELLAQRGLSGLDRIRRAGAQTVGASQEEIALAALQDIVAARTVARPAASVPPLPRAAVDPICGMEVDMEGALHVIQESDTTTYFCSAHCQQAFVDRRVAQHV